MALARTKFGYLTYDDMVAKIADGKLDEYDICYTKDTHECYIVSEDKVPIAIKSKVNTYSSTIDAEKDLNSTTSAYEGQIVAIKYNDRFRAYIVEKNNDVFIVTPLDVARDVINYDTLGDRPIINIKGTVESPVTIGELNEGIYHVSGQYTISPHDKNINLAMRDILFVTDGNGNIQKISGKSIVNYSITNGEVKEDIFATQGYVDSKLITATYEDIANLF